MFNKYISHHNLIVVSLLLSFLRESCEKNLFFVNIFLEMDEDDDDLYPGLIQHPRLNTCTLGF
jgi:hypothetical protein